MAAGDIHRSKDRSRNVAFRLSPDDRELLRQRARLAGLSVQAYLEMVALDRPHARDRRPGPHNAGQEELSLTG